MRRLEEPMTITNGNGKSAGIAVVLAGVDFSALSLEAFGVAQDVAAKAGGELHLVHVLPLPAADAFVASRATRELRYAEMASDVQNRLEQLVARATPSRRSE